MLTKDCRLILDTILSSDSDKRFQAFRISELSNSLNRNFYAILTACKELEKDGFIELHNCCLKNGQELLEFISLTELGTHYKDYLRSQRLRYIADKWIDFLALIIAAIALVVSVAAFFRP